MADDRIRFEDPRTALKRHGYVPKHSFGQNFLVSEKAVAAIVRAAVPPTDELKRVIEIGPGVGTLTAALLSVGAEVLAIERDRDMCVALRVDFSETPGFRLMEADAAKVDYAEILKEGKQVIAGNLPYQLTGRLLRAIIDVAPLVVRAVVMVQEEVAYRLAAPAGDSHRGALSVIIQSRFDVNTVIRLKPTAFHPPPKVRSTVISLTPRSAPLFETPADGKPFDRLVNAAFANRRKTIRNSLAAAGWGTASHIEAMLAEAEISPGIRAERLLEADFLRLLSVWRRSAR